jgi:hypothetical protein
MTSPLRGIDDGAARHDQSHFVIERAARGHAAQRRHAFAAASSHKNIKE